MVAKNRRSASAKCLTDVEVGVITYDQFRMLYYQNPEFGFYLLRLVTGRLQDNVRLARDRAAGTPPSRRGQRQRRRSS